MAEGPGPPEDIPYRAGSHPDPFSLDQTHRPSYVLQEDRQVQAVVPQYPAKQGPAQDTFVS